MKKEVNQSKKIAIILLVIVILIIVPVLLYGLFCNSFHIKNFHDKVILNVNHPFEAEKIDACFGNIFNCKQAKIEVTHDFDSSKLGKYEVIYNIKYREKEQKKIQIVEVKDQISPKIEIEGENFLVCPNGVIPKYNVTALDNVDGDITNNIKSTLENDTIIYEVVDSSGNKTIEKIKAKIEDLEKPTLTLNGDDTLYLGLKEEYKEMGYNAHDNCDGDITKNVKVSNSLDTNTSGEYNIKYSISDSEGNTTELIRKVYVYAKNNYDTPSGKSIYLTFDDGPGPFTNQLLDILNKYNVKATFFVTNQTITKGHDADILRTFQEGHTIGLHTYTHDYKTVYANETAYFDDLSAIQQKVKKITGFESKIIRFPGGSSNTISRGNKKIMTRLSKAVEAKGYRYFDWNVDSNDAGGAKTSDKVFQNVKESLGNNSTYVVLQHDIKGFSVNAVENIIKYGLSHGYTFLPLTMDSPIIHHHINN